MLCAENNRYASDDKALIARIWLDSGWDNRMDLERNLKSVPSAETIRRTRQKLVSEGLIKPSAEATERRYNQYKKAKRDLGYGWW